MTKLQAKYEVVKTLQRYIEKLPAPRPTERERTAAEAIRLGLANDNCE